MVKFRQFILLLWKNFILQKRRPVATFFEIALPLFFSALLVIIRSTVETTNHNTTKTWDAFSVNSPPNFNTKVLPVDRTFRVAFVPSNDSTVQDIMENFDVIFENAKSDLELACPGYAFLTQGNAPEGFGGGFGGMPGGLGFGGPGSGDGPGGQNGSGGMPGLGGGANPIQALRMMSSFFGPDQLAIMLLSRLPEPLVDYIDKLAMESNQTVTDYTAQQITEQGPEVFIQEISQGFLNDTIQCLLDQFDPSVREMMESNSTSLFERATDQNLTSADNASSNSLLEALGAVPKIQAIGFETEADFTEYLKNDTNLAKTMGGIIFLKDEDGLSPNFSYIIRLHADPINVNPTDSAQFTGQPDTWRTTKLFPPVQVNGPRSVDDIYGGRPSYYKEGFLSLMHAVDMAILATVSNTSAEEYANVNLKLKRFPYPPYIQDKFLSAIAALVPLLLMLSFFYTALTIVKSVVHEKETKLKEYLMMTGLSNWLHWSAWFIKYIIFLAISCVLISILYKLPAVHGKVLTYSDGSVVFVYLLSYSAATICFCFMVSVFFNKANVAAAAGGVLFGLSYMPYLFMATRYDQMSHAAKVLSCLISNVGMAMGAKVLSNYEGTGIGVQWWNLNTPVTIDDNFTMLHAILLLLFDAVLYMTIAWYVEGVRPGEYGIPKPWYFPCTRDYWFGPPKKLNVYETVMNGGSSNLLDMAAPVNGGTDKIEDDSAYFENEIPGLRKIVEINGLRKVFNPGAKEKIAVHSLDLNMYEGQITVLLGHNGAGKTTTMSMLTGLYPPTSGFATVMGHNITTDIDLARSSMGLCPQHDILYDQLTVDEHLYFFSRLKGLSSEDSEKECEKMCRVLQLTDKHNARSSTLSGGMKRKLSVGLALCAGSKFIVLDEPTAGMDPSARRAIWDVLQQYRTHCSMLLSTHFMDEADLLGDRIAIMADGKLRCAGSSAFLKNKFGVGYHVVMNKDANCDVNKVTECFQSIVPESRMERTSGAEVSYLLPFESSNLFKNLFTTLDTKMSELGILSYGASVTTMEEVFLVVTEDVMKPVAQASRRLSITSYDEKPPVESPSHATHDILKPPDVPNSGVNLWFQQFIALLIKRVLHTRRNYKVMISQLLVPVVFVIIAILNAKYAPFLEKNRNRPLTLNAYGRTNVAYNRSADVLTFGDMYRDQFPADVADLIFYDGNLENYLSDKYEDEGGSFNFQNIIGATMRHDSNSTKVINSTLAWFNAQAYHSSANSLLYTDQAFIRWKLNDSSFSLNVSNHPLPRNSSARIQEQLIGSISGFMIAFNAVMGFAFLSATFAIFIVRERTDRASLLQTLAGVDPFCFWLSGFTWDFINFLIPCFLCMIVFAAFNVTEYLHNGQFWITLLLFALYCWSSLPLTYLMSIPFTIPTTALVSITIFGAIMGLATIITINVLMIIDDHTRDVGNILDWVFLILPQYCIGQGLADLYTNDKMVNICTSNIIYETGCKQLNITYQTNFMAWERYGVGRFVVFMTLEGFLFFAMLFAIEYDIQGVFLRLAKGFRGKISVRNTTSVSLSDEAEGLNIDEDVIKEQNRINDTLKCDLIETDLIYAKKLRKVYTGKKGSNIRSLVAVDNMCLGVPKGECFGLLGINGAGKTTTFKMLTGDVRPTSGTAFISGQDIVKTRKLAQQNIGYCPQFDGLIEQMTGRETLAMYARLRGVKETYIKAMVEKLAKLLHFQEHIDKECGTYSGGNKRKLSTAIALVGGPAVVLLDEPSTGMDPGARRKLWDTISQICTDKRCIILTSHSMEECEALCTRLAIMVNGQLRCIGGPQHLKTKFGEGYSVEIKLENNENSLDAIKEYVLSNFPGTVVKDEHQGMVSFQVPKVRNNGQDLSLATIFGCMEDAKQQFQLRDYSVSQTTLEQVFLSFARRQREADEL